MAAVPAMSVQTISPGEMQLLLSRAGLILNPGQVADLVTARGAGRDHGRGRVRGHCGHQFQIRDLTLMS